MRLTQVNGISEIKNYLSDLNNSNGGLPKATFLIGEDKEAKFLVQQGLLAHHPKTFLVGNDALLDILNTGEDLLEPTSLEGHSITLQPINEQLEEKVDLVFSGTIDNRPFFEKLSLQIHKEGYSCEIVLFGAVEEVVHKKIIVRSRSETAPVYAHSLPEQPEAPHEGAPKNRGLMQRMKSLVLKQLK